VPPDSFITKKHFCWGDGAFAAYVSGGARPPSVVPLRQGDL
jgi:hypothetical protein